MSGQHTEAWQVFDSLAQPKVNESILPVESRKTSDIIVGAVHVWIWRFAENGKGIEILLQHRAADKPTWPSHFDISVAGHIDAGESPLDAIIREGDEEIGASFDGSQLEFIFSYRNFENGIKWVYLYQEQTPVEYALNDGEVQGLKWVTLEQFISITTSPAENQFVPHPTEYFSFLVKALQFLIK